MPRMSFWSERLDWLWRDSVTCSPLRQSNLASSSSCWTSGQGMHCQTMQQQILNHRHGQTHNLTILIPLNSSNLCRNDYLILAIRFCRIAAKFACVAWLQRSLYDSRLRPARCRLGHGRGAHQRLYQVCLRQGVTVSYTCLLYTSPSPRD